MPRVAPPPPRPPGKPPARRPVAPQTLGEPRDLKDRPRGWKLALRRNRRRLRPALYAGAALVVLAGLFIAVQDNSHDTSLVGARQRFGAVGAALGLRVDSIVIRGQSSTDTPLLEAALGVSRGDPLLGFSVADARARIQQIATVQDVIVQRRWPSTILVSLVERNPFAIWQNQGKFVLIDRAGAVLVDQRVTEDSHLPWVVGIGAPAHAAELYDLLATHPDVLGHVVAASRVGDRRWNLLMTSGASVLLPEDGQDRALARLDQLQADHRLLDRKLQMIDLRLPDRTTLRPDQGAAATPAVPPPAATPDPAPLVPADHTRRPT